MSETTPKSRVKSVFFVFSRIVLGLILFLYGLTKFFRLQDFNIRPGTLITETPSDELFWFFFGYSDLYLNYLGIVECGLALLLWFGRTYRLGLLGSVALFANIALMDFVYDIGPVKYWVTFLTLWSVFLVCLEWKVYRAAVARLAS